MSPRNEVTRKRRPSPVTRAALLVVFVVCLLNAALAVQATRRLEGVRPEELERRYGELRPLLAEVSRAAYLSDARWRFVEARYALAPVILDPGYVELQLDQRSIEAFALDALAADAAAATPVTVLCDFDDRRALEAVLDELSAEARGRGLDARLISRADGLALVSVGD